MSSIARKCLANIKRREKKQKRYVTKHCPLVSGVALIVYDYWFDVQVIQREEITKARKRSLSLGNPDRYLREFKAAIYASPLGYIWWIPVYGDIQLLI